MMIDILSNSINDTNPLVFKLRTNAKKFKIHYRSEIIQKGSFSHVGVTALEGIVLLYKRKKDSSWFYIDTYARTFQADVDLTNNLESKEEYELLIYGPAMAELTELRVELDNDSFIVPVKEDGINNVLVVGGFHTYGIGCTTQAMQFSNILGRKTNSIINNYSLYSKNFLEEYYLKYFINDEKLFDYDICILELDESLQKKEVFEEYLPVIVDLFKKHCKKLICWYAIPPERKSRRKLIKNTFKKYGDDVILEDLSYIYDDEYSQMCLYSKNFINDAGNVEIFKKLKKWM